MTGELRAMDGVAEAGQAAGDIADLGRGAGQPMDQENADLAALDLDGVVLGRAW